MLKMFSNKFAIGSVSRNMLKSSIPMKLNLAFQMNLAFQATSALRNDM